MAHLGHGVRFDTEHPLALNGALLLTIANDLTERADLHVGKLDARLRCEGCLLREARLVLDFGQSALELLSAMCVLLVGQLDRKGLREPHRWVLLGPLGPLRLGLTLIARIGRFGPF